MIPRPLLLLSACLLFGCALPSEDEGDPQTAGDPLQMQAPKMSPDTVVIEVVTADVAFDQLRRAGNWWSQVDELHLPLETRRKLHQQGVRGGVIGPQLPDWLRDHLENQSRTLQVSGAVDGATVQRPIVQQRLQCRAGKSRVFGVRQFAPSVAFSYNQQPLFFEQARCAFDLETEPLGDGRVRMMLTPRIEYGPPKQAIRGWNGAFQWDTQRESRDFPELLLKTELAPGQSLLLTSLEPPQGMGQAFFGNLDQGRQKIVMLRLAQTQQDILFAPDQKAMETSPSLPAAQP